MKNTGASYKEKTVYKDNHGKNCWNKSQKQPPEVFCKKGVLRNCAKLTGKHLPTARPATLLKKRLWHRCFPVNFAKCLRTPFLQNSSGRLLLRLGKSSKMGKDERALISVSPQCLAVVAWILYLGRDWTLRFPGIS